DFLSGGHGQFRRVGYSPRGLTNAAGWGGFGMVGHIGVVGRVNGFAHRHFLGLLAGAYLLAAVWPGAGAAVRHAAVLDTGAGTMIPLPVVLLGFLLFNAGLTADAKDLGGVVRRPAALVAGGAATVAVPLAV